MYHTKQSYKIWTKGGTCSKCTLFSNKWSLWGKVVNATTGDLMSIFMKFQYNGS